jgi:hypothetical protein
MQGIWMRPTEITTRMPRDFANLYATLTPIAV